MPATIFNQPIYPGAKTIDVSGTMSSSPYTIEDERVAASMQAIALELGTPSAFNSNISVECLQGSVKITCTDITGSSTVKVTLLKTDNDPTVLTSTEFDILNNRLSVVENVCTSSNISIQTTDWTLSNGVYQYVWESDLVGAFSCVEIFLRDGAENAGIDDFDFTSSNGSVTFTTTMQPIAALPITIRVIQAKPDGLQVLSADNISSEAISGCDNVEEALSALNSRTNELENIEVTLGSGVTNPYGYKFTKNNKILLLQGELTASNLAGNGGVLFTFPSNIKPIVNESIGYQTIQFQATYNSTDGFFNFHVNSDGTVTTAIGQTALSSRVNFMGFCILVE